MVSGKLKTFNEFQRIYLIGGGSSLIKDKIVKDFYPYRNDIHVIDNVVFKDTCIIIPKSLQQEMLNKIHSILHVFRWDLMSSTKNLKASI